MKGLITTILLGSLAIVLAYNSNSTNVNLNENRPLLSSVFPDGNVPINPDSENSGSNFYSNKFISTLDNHSEVQDKNQRIISQIQPTQELRKENLYTFEVPLYNEESSKEKQGVPYGRELGVDLEGPDGRIYKSPEDDDNNAKEYINKDSFKETTLRKNKKYRTDDVNATSVLKTKETKLKKSRVWEGNNNTQLEGAAGTGYHQVAHLDGHYEVGLGHDDQQLQQLQPIIPHGIGNSQAHPPILVYENEKHPEEPVHVYGPHQEILNLGHVGEHKIIHTPHAKPLKPSVVHRDPHDTYDHHDKVRTQDHDDKENGHNAYSGIGFGVEDVSVTGFQPYHYDMYKIPECAHQNRHYYNLTFCLEDHAYPLQTILWAIHASGPYAHQLHSDVTYQSADNLVTGLTKAEEEGYTYKHYFGATHAQHTNLDQYKPPYHGYTYKTDYFKNGGYICPSDIYYARPKRAMNTYGKWKVLVNVDQIPKPNYGDGLIKRKREILDSHKGHAVHKKGFTQTLRLEQCIYPDAPCSYIDSHYHSKCIQKHNFVRLVAWTHDEGLHVDTFKMPIACSCHIPQPIHFYQESGHHEETNGVVVPPVVNGYDTHHHLSHHHPGRK